MTGGRKILLLVSMFIAFCLTGIGQSFGIENESGQSPENVIGEWQQFTYRDGKWRTLGVFLLDKTRDGYSMTPVIQVSDKTVTNSRGLFDIGFKGEEWHFKSDWGQGRKGEFRLHQISPGAYLGSSYLNGKKINDNLWLRIK